MSVRYARQLAVPGIGTDGQARIEARGLQPGCGDPRVLATAFDYLERGGSQILPRGIALDVSDRAEVDRVAGWPELREIAAFLLGTLAATREIHAALGSAPVAVDVPCLAASDHP